MFQEQRRIDFGLVGMIIDPDMLASRVSNLIKVETGRPLDGPMFTTMIRALAQALNETLEPLFFPVLKMVTNPNMEAQEMNKLIADMNKHNHRAVLVDHIDKPRRVRPQFMCETEMWKPIMAVHDEVLFEKKDDRVDALLHTYVPFDKLREASMAEPNLMKEWPTPPGPMTTSHVYQCRDRGCPTRAPMSSASAPICYTCGRHMELK